MKGLRLWRCGDAVRCSSTPCCKPPTSAAAGLLPCPFVFPPSPLWRSRLRYLWRYCSSSSVSTLLPRSSLWTLRSCAQGHTEEGLSGRPGVWPAPDGACAPEPLWQPRWPAGRDSCSNTRQGAHPRDVERVEARLQQLVVGEAVVLIAREKVDLRGKGGGGGGRGRGGAGRCFAQGLAADRLGWRSRRALAAIDVLWTQGSAAAAPLTHLVDGDHVAEVRVQQLAEHGAGRKLRARAAGRAPRGVGGAAAGPAAAPGPWARDMPFFFHADRDGTATKAAVQMSHMHGDASCSGCIGSMHRRSARTHSCARRACACAARAHLLQLGQLQLQQAVHPIDEVRLANILDVGRGACTSPGDITARHRCTLDRGANTTSGDTYILYMRPRSWMRALSATRRLTPLSTLGRLQLGAVESVKLSRLIT